MDLGVDFSQYAGWRRVQSPNGQIYYVVPGNEGYVYDPFMSQMKGKTVLFTNPESAYEEKKKAEKKAKDALSPWNQLAPAALGTLGQVGGKYLGDAAGNLFDKLGSAASSAFSTGASVGASHVANTGASAIEDLLGIGGSTAANTVADTGSSWLGDAWDWLGGLF